MNSELIQQNALSSRKDVIAYCLTFAGVYEDYPFHDPNWTVMRCRSNTKTFALLFEKDGILQINVKCNPDWAAVYRSAYPASVLPGYHMNKKYWNTLLINDTLPDNELRRMIAESYDLVSGRQASPL